MIIFSIGNPGPMNRHSAGHLMLKLLMDNYSIKQLVKKSTYSISSSNNYKMIFIKSNSYMNESNKSWQSLIKLEKLNLVNSIILILYDDFENDLSEIRISQFKNKNESHNGIKNLSTIMNFDNVYKFGIGIGPKPKNATREIMSSWVLSKFKPEEIAILESISLQKSIMFIEEIMEMHGDIIDINKFNSKLNKMWKSMEG
ncbi:uncharacterized protein J8A68_000915 [[Candida] subhashii]|uniref:Peptidyl-tRNA hydrolase n=1 Tax=[Candida] subhashii TaxID=561895 RepID=A0A8J5QS96_9ASCO|nr:uncharacterized protein J8A68_000915 [[Candida] subhashii]KAG7665513.1 hypothetical protein J8A68_000915 [[Candida] subhashii]